MYLPVQFMHSRVDDILVLSPRHSIHPGRRIPLQVVETLDQQRWRDVVEKRSELHPPIPTGGFTYAFESQRHLAPTLSSAGGVLSDIPLGYAPSLHRLRRFPFVRRLLRYYWRIRLLGSVDDRIAVIDLPCPAQFNYSGHCRDLPASVQIASRHAQGL